MPLRIGFDMDGVIADFARAYREIEERLYGPSVSSSRAGDPEEEAAQEEDAAAQADAGAAAAPAAAKPRPDGGRRRRDAVWRAIESVPNFWTTLAPLDETAVRRIHDLMIRHRWEVFFITQRPATEGDTVQRQTQRWLVEHGFDLPSVLVVPGSRGAAAAALSLDYHVDDSPKNCIDVKSESGARPLLIVSNEDELTTTSARRLGIGTARSISHALDILDQASLTRTQPGLLHRLAKLVGWH